MPSATEPVVPDLKNSSGAIVGTVKAWNRKLHYYLGLYLFFFICLFSFTGLLLNHPQWTFAGFWDQRQQTAYDRDINPPPPGASVDQARDIMRQLTIAGEIEWTESRNDTNQFNFRASRPGHIYDIKTDLARKRVSVKQIDLNLWGVAHILHTFTGVRRGDSQNDRDWFLTKIWAFAMDAVAIGLIFMVLSSLQMWCETPPKRLTGFIVLTAGVLSCALFCLGLRWLY